MRLSPLLSRFPLSMVLFLSHGPLSRTCSLSLMIILLGFPTFRVIQLTRKPEALGIWLLSGRGWGTFAPRSIHIMGLFWERMALSAARHLTSMRQCFLRGSFGLKSQLNKMNDGLMSCEFMPRATCGLKFHFPVKKTFCTHCFILKILPPAWRLLPEVTVDAMTSYFIDIMEDTALPPMQVGVWIPKAKMGPEADNFRPLGMPNTLDRLVDGTIASVVMKAVAPNMHPSQTVMSMFKEPARAVTAIQSFLDSSKASCALLADLSKAFERVNPYWILALLRSKGAPAWVIRYSRFVLFERRVTHKVQGRLLPSRVIRQGVDMGRSFSVFLFCFAMDPLFHYLNRIPKVLSVQAYVDDTTLVGDAQDLRWIQNVAQCYDDVRTAGFVVDSHSCYRSISNCTMRFGPTLMTSARLIQEWPGIISSPAYATATAAIQAVSRLGYNTLIVRVTRWPLTPLLVEPEDPSKQHLAINLNF